VGFNHLQSAYIKRTLRVCKAHPRERCWQITHTQTRQSLACVSLLFQHKLKSNFGTIKQYFKLIIEQEVCGGPLAFHYGNLLSHTARRQSLACVGIHYYQRNRLQIFFSAQLRERVDEASTQQHCLHDSSSASYSRTAGHQ
jgi:hypothetical protein